MEEERAPMSFSQFRRRRRTGTTLLAVLVGVSLAAAIAPFRSDPVQANSSCPGKADQADDFASPSGYKPNGLHAWLRADMCTDNISGNSFRYWFGSDTRNQANGSYKNVDSISQTENAWNGDDSNSPCTKINAFWSPGTTTIFNTAYVNDISGYSDYHWCYPLGDQQGTWNKSNQFTIGFHNAFSGDGW